LQPVAPYWGLKIAKTLNQDSIRTRSGNPWNKNVVHYMLKNEAYAGTLLFNKPKSRQVGPSAAEGLIRIENAHPAIVPHDAFLRVQVLLHERSPQVIHPRLLTSEYLLSGLAYCGWCQRKLIGCSAKSGRFHYYACQRVLKQGRAACRGGFIPRLKLEAAVLERLKHRVLTEANLTSLVELVNQELSQAVRETHTRREEVQSHIEELRARLHKLYGALETGQLSLEDLAPRIKELRSQIEESESRHSSFDSTRETALRLRREEVLSQVGDFQQVLLGGSFLERKRFLRSFIRRVVIPHDGDEGSGEMEYTLPLVPQGLSQISKFFLLSKSAHHSVRRQTLQNSLQPLSRIPRPSAHSVPKSLSWSRGRSRLF
jgi:hypothetical protein